ncbi:MAG: orotidine-5'-phosphate decarboxylase [Patescibacteria group bacterium]|nr:orotidine-5'-phosphate decarboxylase [Patescibacteria group bacterium]
MNFIQKLTKIAKKNNSLVCVGLDSDLEKIPRKFVKKKYPQFEFNKWIIEQTHDLVCAYKPNSAFYEAQGAKGIEELKMTYDYLRQYHPEIVTILDAKRGDIGNTNKGYVNFIFDHLGSDAVTMHPYLGREAIQPFLDRADKGCILLCRTSNPGAGEFQDLKIKGVPLYLQVAKKISKKWNTNSNCLLVVGATYPEELKKVRKIAGNRMWFLVPGIGVQGGDVEKTIIMGQNKEGNGLIINSARAIIFSQDPRGETGELQKEINQYRKEKK